MGREKGLRRLPKANIVLALAVALYREQKLIYKIDTLVDMISSNKKGRFLEVCDRRKR